VTRFGDLFALLELTWYSAWTVGVLSITTAIVQVHALGRVCVGFVLRSRQAFFTFRVYAISHKLWLTAPIWAASLFSCALGITTSAAALQEGSLLVFKAKHGWIMYAAIVVNVIVGT
jgi:hypothetical protein